MAVMLQQFVSLCITSFAIIIIIPVVEATVIGPYKHNRSEAFPAQITTTDEVALKESDLIRDLARRVEELEQTLHEIRLDREIAVISRSGKGSGNKRRKRTNDTAERGDTNLPDGGNSINSGVSMNPYWIGQCILCPTGPQGPPGPIGPQGASGRDGRDGRDALLGNNIEGLSPLSPTETPERDHHTHDNSSGAIYTRWGRNECPSSAQSVYQGIVAGAHFTHTGSGSNFLCLPLEPIYDRPWPGRQGEAGALIYGAEYQTGGFAPWAGLHDHEVPCSVCRAPSRTSHLMLPARNECPDESWTKEYAGWLVAAHHNHKRSEFVCMDKEPEAVPRSATNQDGALFYLVEGRCVSNGGLPCGPYVDGYELTCAVCTR